MLFVIFAIINMLTIIINNRSLKFYLKPRNNSFRTLYSMITLNSKHVRLVDISQFWQFIGPSL